MTRVINRVKLTRAARVTLVQLLVLIAVIVMIAALLVPMVWMLRKKSVVSGCESNLAQLVQAYNTHISSTKVGASSPSQQTKTSWAQILKSESGLPDKTYICPIALESSPNFGSVSESWSQVMDFPQGKAKVISSYGMNGWLMQPDRLVLRYSGGKPEQFFTSTSPDPEKIPVFADAMWQDGWPHADDGTPSNLRDGDRANQDGPVERQHMLGRFTLNRHNKAINVAFRDGHVETVQLKNLKRLMWHIGFQAGDWQPPLPEE